MTTFHRIRPWLAGVGHLLVLAAFLALPAIDHWDFVNSAAFGIPYMVGFLAIWIATLVLTSNSPAERGGFFVRHGAALWVASLLLTFPLAFLFKPWYSDEEDSLWYDSLWWGALFLLMHLIVLSAIHVARFHIPRLRQKDGSNELIVRKRRGGRLALSIRLTGMLFIAAGVVDVIWMPVVVIPDPSSSDYLDSWWFAGVLASVGAGILYLSRFATDLGKGKLKVVVE